MDKQLLRLEGVKPVMLLLAAVSLAQGAAVVIQAFALAKAISDLFAGGPMSESLPLLLLFAAAYAFRHGMGWLQRRIAAGFADRSAAQWRDKLLQGLLAKGARYAAGEGSGKLVALAMEGTDQIRAYIRATLPRGSDMALVTAAAWVAVAWHDVPSAIILALALPLLVGFLILFGLAARKQADRQWQSFRLLAHHFTDSLRGLETLRFLGRSRSHGRSVERVSDEYRGETMKTLRVAFLSSFALDFFTMLSVASVAVALGLRLVEGGIALYPALAVLLLAPEFFVPVRQLGADFHATLDGKEAWAAMRAVTDKTAGEVPAALSVAAGAKSAAAVRWDGQLELSGVSVIGKDGTAMLRDVSVVLPVDARRIGIVGMSGAGKSTLLDVLGGFLAPSAGALRIGGSELYGDAPSISGWRHQLAYIPQHPHLFGMSLANNIRFYEPQADDSRVDEAIRQTGLDSLAQELAAGGEQQLGEGGRQVSGGQAQRIALARALISERPVWLLDEPTAHLDIETEWELKQTMLSLFGEKRLFLATHRLHWMPQMDFILVLAEGKLAEAGTHQQLLAGKGEYYRLYCAQKGGSV